MTDSGHDLWLMIPDLVLVHFRVCDIETFGLILQVKADRGNKKLQRLQQASRHVTDMAASVVTSTKAGQMQIEDMGKNWGNFAGLGRLWLDWSAVSAYICSWPWAGQVKYLGNWGLKYDAEKKMVEVVVVMSDLVKVGRAFWQYGEWNFLEGWGFKQTLNFVLAYGKGLCGGSGGVGRG